MCGMFRYFELYLFTPSKGLGSYPKIKSHDAHSVLSCCKSKHLLIYIY